MIYNIDKVEYVERVAALESPSTRTPVVTSRGGSIVAAYLEGMQYMRQTFLVVVMIFATAIAILLGIAIWPHLPLIGIVASWVASDILLCVGIVVPVATFFFLRWLWFHSSVVRRGEIVVGHYRGEARLLSAEHEASKRPLQLAAPVITEMRELSAEDQDIIDRSRVLAAHFEQGKGMHAIEKELGIPYNKVRDWCNTATALRAKQQSW